MSGTAEQARLTDAPRAGSDLLVRRGAFRPDIEGLRAVAILSVLVFHATEFTATSSGSGILGAISRAFALVSGGFLGVDVFFVISGFLITGILVREAESTDRIHFGRFYARRARRILPAASLTLLTTLIVSSFALSASRSAATARDVFWAALFNSDVHFANSGIDYMGVSVDPSPVLHFWSLNDEEKFYVIWPAVLVVATVFAVRYAKTRLRPTLFLALAAIAIPSLLWSAHLVSISDPSGYFSAFSRAFELAAGGLLAIAMPAVVRLPRAVRATVPLVGLFIVATCMFTYTTLTPFPGFGAVPVVLGTVMVLAGHNEGVVSRGLSLAPMRWFGRISFSLYLWHWPLLVIVAALTVGGQISTFAMLLCLLVSVLAAWASYRWIEQPFQRAPLLRGTQPALVFGAAAIVVTAGLALIVEHAAQEQVASEYAAASNGIVRISKSDPGLLLIGDSITARGQVALETALSAAGWDYRIDALGSRPIVSGSRAKWSPICSDKPLCGADLVLADTPIPATVVVALGTNSMRLRQTQVGPPTATSSGLRNDKDGRGHYIPIGQDSPTKVARQVRQVMAKVPITTTVYWVGIWLDDKLWDNISWRESNTAIKATAARYPNARFLDYATFVTSSALPYSADGSHPTPEGMIGRARWIVSQLK